jgi:hypothetical protein
VEKKFGGFGAVLAFVDEFLLKQRLVARKISLGRKHCRCILKAEVLKKSKMLTIVRKNV